MRIALVNPNLSGDVSILDMGVTTLATYLNERTTHQASIIDFTFRRHAWKDALRQKLSTFKPDVVGITATSLYMPYIRQIASEVKHTHKKPILLGGYHPSLMPDESLAEKDVDAICLGDGEYAVTEYLNTLEGGQDPIEIPGIWAKVRGEIYKPPKRPLIQDLDALPIQNYDLWDDLDHYLTFMNLLYFIGCRGCPYDCTYCSSWPMKQAIPGQHYRRRDPRAFAREIEYQYKKYAHRGMRIAHTFDPVFTVSKPWLEAFADEYIRSGMAHKLPYSCFSRLDALDEERVELLKASNCRVIRLGIEAGNERIRNEIYEKNISDAQIRHAMRLCQKAGLTITAYNMLGGPTETKATLRDTFRINRELDVHRPVFFIYRPLPKTKGAELVEATGGSVDCEKLESIDSLHFGGCVSTGDLSPKDVERFQALCFSYFITRRLARLVGQQKHRFFLNLADYMVKARLARVPLEYATAYFLICCGDNLTS